MNSLKIVKLLLLAFMLFVLLFNAGCSYNESPNSPDYYSNSYFYVINKNDWESTSEAGHWFKRIDVSGITKSVIDYGTVFVYYRNSLNNWVLLPYSTTLYNSNGQQFAEEIWAGYALGTLDIDYVYTNPLDMTPPSELTLKIVILFLY
jgi:hypothetical protein